MYLFHITNHKYLKSILTDGMLKSSYLTGNLNQGDGIYKHIKFVFFSVIDDYESKQQIYGDVVLYFDYKMLWNRTFFVSTYHSDTPVRLCKGEQVKKYNQYYKYTKRVLTKLFQYSISKSSKVFWVFQQVAIKNQCNLKNLKMIRFQQYKPTKVIVKLIKNKYPDVIIDFTQYNFKI